MIFKVNLEEEVIKSLETGVFDKDDIEPYIGLIVQSLEKHIPRPVIYNGYGVYFCPVCHGSLWQIKCESNYCFRCGQKVDWNNIKKGKKGAEIE